MKVFVAGASGVVGRYLIPQLIGAGHDVVAMTRSPGKTSWLRELGAEPVLADALDQPAVAAAVARARPQAVVHQLTAIPARPGARTFDRVFAPTNRLRTGGTDILLAAARAAGARRFVAQSFCGWTYARAGGPVKTEEDPLFAGALAAKPPRHVPAWLVRPFSQGAVVMANEIRGACNAKAKRQLGWKPAYPSWRDGFRNGLAQ